MNARSADFAATAPWSGITGKPSSYPTDPALLSAGSARDQSLLIFDAAASRWRPATPSDVAALLRSFLAFTADDVGLGSVDNTSDQQKNEAVATLTNKTILGAVILLIQQLGIRSPTGFNLFLATDSELSTDRTLTLLLDDIDRSIELRASLVLAGDDVLTISVNGAPRLVDLEGDLTLRGGDLIVELSDGTGTGEDRTLTLQRDLSLIGGGNFTISVDADTVFNLGGDFTTSGPITTIGVGPTFFTFTGATAVTFPEVGTLSTLDGVETLTNKTLTAPHITTPTGIVKGDVGLGNVDNTSDVNKPVSTAQAAADAAATAAANATSDATKQPLTGNSFAVAGLPAAGSNVGRCVYCTNGSAGAPCAAISDGTNWKVIAIGATVSP